eukprot:Gb_00901 [translate_table: standard]
MRQIAKVMPIKLLCLQCYTHFPTNLMSTIAGVAEGKRYNWCNFVRNRMQTLLKKVAEAPRRASFFLPTIFMGLLFHQIYEAQLPTPQELPNTLKLLAWTEVYGCGDINKLEEISTTTPSHGQRRELQQVEDAEDRRRKKGKYKVEEDAPRSTLEEPPQPSTVHAGTLGVH